MYGLKCFIMLSNFSPLVLLYALQGSVIGVEGGMLWCCSLILFILLNIPFIFTLLAVITRKDLLNIKVRSAKDTSEYIVSYLFAMLLTIYSIELQSIDDLVLLVAIVGLSIHLFAFANMHCVSILMTFCGYRLFTVSATYDDDLLCDTFFVVSRRNVMSNTHITGYRIGGNVLMEYEVQYEQ